MDTYKKGDRIRLTNAKVANLQATGMSTALPAPVNGVMEGVVKYDQETAGNLVVVEFTWPGGHHSTRQIEPTDIEPVQ